LIQKLLLGLDDEDKKYKKDIISCKKAVLGIKHPRKSQPHIL